MKQWSERIKMSGIISFVIYFINVFINLGFYKLHD